MDPLAQYGCLHFGRDLTQPMPADFLHLLVSGPFSDHVEDKGGLQLQRFRAAEGMVLPQLGHVGALLDLLYP